MLKVEIAITPSAHEKGLMFRKSMPSDNGMLFIFAESYPRIFWGRNTYIPLDIAFVDNDRIVKISHIPALSERPVSSDTPCSMAIEANIGYFHQYGIKPGHKIDINKLNEKVAMLTFLKYF